MQNKISLNLQSIKRKIKISQIKPKIKPTTLQNSVLIIQITANFTIALESKPRTQ